MFKTDSFLGNKKLSFNQNVWRDHATMQQDVLLHFWVIFLHWNQAEIWKKICCPALKLFHFLPLWKTVLFVSSRAFLLSTPTFLLSTLYKISEATWKKATKCNKALLLCLTSRFVEILFIMKENWSMLQNMLTLS